MLSVKLRAGVSPMPSINSFAFAKTTKAEASHHVRVGLLGFLFVSATRGRGLSRDSGCVEPPLGAHSVHVVLI